MKANPVEELEPVVGLTEFHFRCLEKHIAECDESLMEVVTSARAAENEEPANDGVCALCNVLQAARMLAAAACEMSHRLHASVRPDSGYAPGPADACSELARPVRDAHQMIKGLRAKFQAVLDAEERSVERANGGRDDAQRHPRRPCRYPLPVPDRRKYRRALLPLQAAIPQWRAVCSVHGERARPRMASSAGSRNATHEDP